MPPDPQRLPAPVAPPSSATDAVFAALPWPALLLDAADSVVAANPACGAIAPASGFVGAPAVGLAATPVLGRALLRALAQARSDGEVKLDGFSLRNGIAHDLWLRALPGADGRCLLLLLPCAEPQARMQALEQANRELRAAVLINGKLAQVADHTNSAVIISDRLRRVIWTNRAFARITGHDGALASGQPQAEFIGGPGTDPATLRHIDAELAAGRAVDYIELLAHRRDGAPYWASVSIQPVAGDDGLPGRHITVLHDISASRQAADARHAMLYAEAASHAKTDFLARLGHEMRAPLNAVIGHAELLRHDANLNLHGQPGRLVSSIGSAARQLLGMVDQAVDLARTERATLRLRWAEVDCVRTVRDATDMIDPALTRRDVELRIRPPLGAPVIAWADRERLEEILIQLLSNAVRDCADGGVVDVTTRLDGAGAQARIEIDHPLAPGDVGADRLADSLEPRADAAAPAPRELGLSIAQWLAVMMNGRIDARRDAAGLHLSLALPLPQPAARRGHDSRAPAREPGPLTLLYLDDDALDVALLEAMLEAYPTVRLHVASQRDEAIELMRLLKPDRVLLADHIAGSRPADFVQRLVAARAAPAAAPRIALIAPAGRQTESLPAGSSLRLVKPLTVQQLLQLLDAPAAS
ncbi:PAS domain-containing sensor histidine kinase [Derxia lacustris]|uniref:PAS domain-containing sensor histidine kinase n=1 Tax=Derxia lacustris TaxID=764842 RepID=UPI000A178374|nr:PAS domain-containing protein [Derxia lacustris]